MYGIALAILGGAALIAVASLITNVYHRGFDAGRKYQRRITSQTFDELHRRGAAYVVKAPEKSG